MRIITLNVNGIRSAARKGFFQWLAQQNADVVCLQEIRAHQHQLDDEIYRPAGYHCYYVDAQKKGYSGVALYSRKKPDNITVDLGWDLANHEGRYIQADFGDLSVASLYLPSGSSGDERQIVKYQFLDYFTPVLAALRNQARKYVICGDWNIAHQPIDLRNWKANQVNSGFLPAERAWMSHLFDEIGFVDSFRVLNQEPDQYTWWSNRGQAWAKNVGWRIDYQIISPNLKSGVQSVSIYKNERFSDHAPLIVDYCI